MPWNMGLMGASLPGINSDFVLLETQILASPSTSVTFSSLNTYASTYQHLQVRYVARTTSTVGERTVVYLRVNSDEATNYSRHVMFSSDGAGSVPSTGNANQNYLEAPPAPSALCASGVFGSGIVDILDAFETTKFKTSRALGGFMNSTSAYYHKVMFASSNWRSNSAISSLKIDSPGTSFETGSRFSIYGLKAA